jgi:hypothetical protein
LSQKKKKSIIIIIIRFVYNNLITYILFLSIFFLFRLYNIFHTVFFSYY